MGDTHGHPPLKPLRTAFVKLNFYPNEAAQEEPGYTLDEQQLADIAKTINSEVAATFLGYGSYEFGFETTFIFEEGAD